VNAFYLVYRGFGWPLLSLTLRGVGRFVPKIRSGLEARRSIEGKSVWASGPKSENTVWIHCASGEFEYAKPVITLLKQEDPTAFVLVTYFSTSFVKAIAHFPGVDAYCPLPWDTPGALKEFLAYHKPKTLLVARTDVWPEMARQAHLANVRSLLFSATLTSKSGRARGLGKWMSKATFSNLTSIFAVSDDDTKQFEELSLPKTKIVKAGDTRYDQVLERLSKPKPLKESLFASQGQQGLPVVVCGSTWPEDEAQILTAIAELKGQARFIVVPHEPDEAHLVELEERLSSLGLKSCRYSKSETWQNDVLLIDTIGILAELYLKADYAFVGGSFKKNVHSVMEPLAAGCLTLVGPFHSNNREALAFRQLPVSGSEARLTMVTEVSSSSAIVKTITEAKKVPLEALKREIQNEVRARTGASRKVVDWVLGKS
jgi:3-deoxy-D-manno-octulosonic-acid transferase